ncbi:MAG TPA: DUF5063 domain-containing protein [Leptospiraceae bacterium]|nr:DUF5063 domain-containing protein [Leptospiraceae bacterium]
MPDVELSLPLKEFLNKNTTQTFLATAQTFIDLLEIEAMEHEEFLFKAHSALIDLYASGHKLEEIDLKDSHTESNFNRIELFKDKNIGLISTLGDKSYYSEVFNPIDKEEKEPMQGWLVDDFADIYRDLKTELEKMKIGTSDAIEDALWQMKFGYNYHWGNHCINALRALHFMRNYEL